MGAKYSEGKEMVAEVLNRVCVTHPTLSLTERNSLHECRAPDELNFKLSLWPSAVW